MGKTSNQIKEKVVTGNIIAFDGCSSKIRFLNLLKTQSELKNSLDEQLKSNKKWVEKAAQNQIYFIINDFSWKNNANPKPTLRLNFIGPEEKPTISIDL